MPSVDRRPTTGQLRLEVDEDGTGHVGVAERGATVGGVETPAHVEDAHHAVAAHPVELGRGDQDAHPSSLGTRPHTSDQPFTEPSVSPPRQKRCSTSIAMTSGMIDSSTPPVVSW